MIAAVGLSILVLDFMLLYEFVCIRTRTVIKPHLYTDYCRQNDFGN